MRAGTLAPKLCLSLAATTVCIASLELGLRGYHATRASLRRDNTPAEPKYIRLPGPTLYGLNPQYPGFNSHGQRDDEITLAKPVGMSRILVLGDSIAYGQGVAADKTFPNQLEQMLRREDRRVEVINAAVPGYTAYNELQYYVTKGRLFEPDVVLLAFCMNDVVNPRLHWGYTSEEILDIPDDAIPNRDYDQNHAIPALHERRARRERRRGSLLQHSELYRAVEWRLSHRREQRYRQVGDERAGWPTYLAGEDTLSIEVLVDESSAEWQWLRRTYDRLRREVAADGARLIVVIFPLAYQLDPGYPFLPQEPLARYWTQHSIPYVDLLPAFRRHSKRDLFLLENLGVYDVWHLTPYGHSLAARAIRDIARAPLRVAAGEVNATLQREKIASIDPNAKPAAPAQKTPTSPRQ